MSPRIAVVGGGITGLSAAYELVKSGRSPVLVDSSARLGGVIETSTIEGCVLEGGPDSFLSAKPAAAELIRELGLGDELIGSNDSSRVTYVVKRGKLVPLPDGLLMMVPTKVLPLALSPLLTWKTKIRMGLEWLRRPPHTELPDRTVGDFIRDHYGQEAVDYLADPLLSGVYGGSAERLSVNSVLARFVELEKTHGSLTRGVLSARKAAVHGAQTGPLFLTLKRGLQQLVDALEERVRSSTDVVQAQVNSVVPAAGGWRLRTSAGDHEAAGVILAVPAWIAGRLLRETEQKLSVLLENVEYSSSVTLSLGYRKEQIGTIPPGFGFLVPAAERRTLVACTFIGAKFPYRVPDSHLVLRCFLGGAGREAVLDESDEILVRTVRQELSALLGWDAEPDFINLRRWRKAMAQYAVGHSARISRVMDLLQGLPGLQLAGNAYEGIGISDCVRTGRLAARRLVE